jgi:hypothetical protein
MLWIILLVLLILVLAGGFALTKFVWLLLVVLLVVALISLFSGRSAP